MGIYTVVELVGVFLAIGLVGKVIMFIGKGKTKDSAIESMIESAPSWIKWQEKDE